MIVEKCDFCDGQCVLTADTEGNTVPEYPCPICKGVGTTTPYRKEAVVSAAWFGREDHGLETFFVKLDYGGSGQGFGGLVLDERTDAAMRAELSALFGVGKVEEIVGRSCTALYSLGEYNEEIEGLEVDVLGKPRRLTLTGFGRRHWTTYVPKIFRIRNRIRSRIDSNERANVQLHEDLAGLDTKFVDWETEP